MSLNYSLISIAIIWLSDCKYLSTLALLMIVHYCIGTVVESIHRVLLLLVDKEHFSFIGEIICCFKRV